MINADLIIKTRGQLVTCASADGPKRGAAMQDVGIITGGAASVIEGKIAAVGIAEEIERDYSSNEVYDAGEKAIVPGFVDPHTHIVFAGSRLDEFELKIKGADYLEILRAGGGILSTVQKTREAGIEDLTEQALARLDKMLRCGSTTVEIKTGYGLDLESELKLLRVIEELDRLQPVSIVPTFLPAHAVPPEHRDDPDRYVEAISSKMLPGAWQWYASSHFYRRTPLFADVFTEKSAFDLDQTLRILTAAKQLGFRLKAHVDEFTNLGGSRLAVELGATSIDHLDEISDKEVEMLAESETVGVITPTVNFNFGSSRYADARRLIDSGCAIALSTDYNPGSAPCPSQPAAMAIACRHQKLLPAEALNAATINAAYAVGLGEHLGSIAIGKRADLLVADCSDFRQIAYEFGSTKFERVFIGGVRVV